MGSSGRPHFTSDDRVRAVSLTSLRRFAVRYPQVRIVFGHEILVSCPGIVI
jgi:hypothetical protein